MHDKYYIPLIIFGTLVFIMFVFILTTFLIIHKQRQRRYQLERSETEYKYRNQLLLSRLEVEELALKTVSSEIHDNVNQILGIVRMSLFHARQSYSREETDATVDEANDMVKDVIDNLRNLSHTLSGSGINKMGIINAIRKELANIHAHSQVQTKLVCEEEDLPLEGEQELLVFRIIQEALSNVIKHACASMVEIAITYAGDQLAISVRDNGVGITADHDARDTGGIGMVNMHERAKILGGTLTIESEKGAGCTLRLQMHLPEV